MELKEKDSVPQTYKEWFRADLRHVEEWRKEAKLDFEFRDGHHWTEDEKRILDDREQPATTFNFVLPIVDAVCGQEIGNRKEVRYLPRVPPAEDGGQDENSTDVLTEAARFFRDQADADDNDSEAFRDTITCGMGWTETRLDYEDNPDGELRVDRIDPFEMIWDGNARKKNLEDAARIWHVKSMPIAEARALVPGYDDDELDADWAAAALWTGDEATAEGKVRDRTRRKTDGTDDLAEAIIVHCQWIERESVWRVPIPGAGFKSFREEEYKKFEAEFTARYGEAPPNVVKQKRKVRYRAYLGKVVLKVTPTACPDHFNFKCITGKRDQTRRQWFGLVRPMRDPASWSNKFFAQILHILNSSAKGGIVAERGTAFDNDEQAQESWARTDRITWMKPGALGQSPKWAEKPQVQFPQGLQFLMEYAANATRTVSGVNQELLGQRDANQPGVLEYQRKQAGLTILQPLFDSLKSYRREQGELILWYIQNDLSDGRLVRIVGDRKAQYVPLTHQATLEYDVIVDDMPTSPNQKEMSWAIISQMLPVMKDVLTPDTLMLMLKASPLPPQVVEDMQKGQEEQAQSPMAQLEQRMAALEAALAESKIKLTNAQAEKAQADAAATIMDAQRGDGTNPEAELALKAQEASAKIAIKDRETEGKLRLQARKQAGDAALAQQKQASDFALKQRDQMHAQSMQDRNAAADIAMRDRASTADIARKDQQAKAAARRPKPQPAR